MSTGNSRSGRRYCGSLKAVVFDWAGTIVDYGSCAPAGVFIEVFKRRGVTISQAEARAPMGMEKRAHLSAIAAVPEIRQRWQNANESGITERDIDQMYAEFLPLQIACLPQYADLISGTLELVEGCRRRGMKIGTSTGYARVLMDVLVPEAAQRGLRVDVVVTADEVPQGRPAPWMCIENAKRLGIWPMQALAVVDDTIPGVEAGLNAGMWTVAVAKSGNELGLSFGEIAALSATDCQHRLDAAYNRFLDSGAHYVVDTVAQLMPVLDDIEARLRRGETP